MSVLETVEAFPPTWSIEGGHACIMVLDVNGEKLAYDYFQNEAGRQTAAKLLTYDETRSIAA